MLALYSAYRETGEEIHIIVRRLSGFAGSPFGEIPFGADIHFCSSIYNIDEAGVYCYPQPIILRDVSTIY